MFTPIRPFSVDSEMRPAAAAAAAASSSSFHSSSAAPSSVSPKVWSSTELKCRGPNRTVNPQHHRQVAKQGNLAGGLMLVFTKDKRKRCSFDATGPEMRQCRGRELLVGYANFYMVLLCLDRSAQSAEEPWLYPDLTQLEYSFEADPSTTASVRRSVEYFFDPLASTSMAAFDPQAHHITDCPARRNSDSQVHHHHHHQHRHPDQPNQPDQPSQSAASFDSHAPQHNSDTRAEHIALSRAHRTSHRQHSAPPAPVSVQSATSTSPNPPTSAQVLSTVSNKSLNVSADRPPSGIILLPPESSVEVIYLGSVMLTRLANPEADGALNDEIRQAGSTVKKKKEKKKKKKDEIALKNQVIAALRQGCKPRIAGSFQLRVQAPLSLTRTEYLHTAKTLATDARVPSPSVPAPAPREKPEPKTKRKSSKSKPFSGRGKTAAGTVPVSGKRHSKRQRQGQRHRRGGNDENKENLPVNQCL
mmetsp:Transcript_2067/g.6542  ORF Transcript_2067/g.6542 Transcript_2067/m.6542 type:complete len:473 (-) Transcript_2067:172-1590(-)